MRSPLALRAAFLGPSGGVVAMHVTSDCPRGRVSHTSDRHRTRQEPLAVCRRHLVSADRTATGPTTLRIHRVQASIPDVCMGARSEQGQCASSAPRCGDTMAGALVPDWHDVPRSPLGAAAADGILVGRSIVVAITALLPVRGGELPGFVDVLLAGEQAPPLLLAGDMEEELDDEGAALREQLLEMIDVRVALFPDVARHELMHACDQHVLVVRAIEDPYNAERGRPNVDAPEKVVALLFGGWHFEAGDFAAHRVDPCHDVLDGAVLARGIHTLQHYQHTLPLRRVEQLLQPREAPVVP